MNIREAKINDVEYICDMWEEMMKFHYERNGYFLLDKNARQKYTEYLKICMKKKKGYIVVAEIENKVVGYLMAEKYHYPPVYIIKTYVEILELYVKEDFRRMGIASQLLSEAKEWTKKREITRLECKYSTSNEVSTSFWKKSGFENVMETGYMSL